MQLPLIEFLEKIAHNGFSGDKDTVINEVVKLTDDPAENSKLLWCGEKYLEGLDDLTHGTVITTDKGLERLSNNNTFNGNIIATDNPRLTFAEFLNHIVSAEEEKPFISDAAQIHKTVILGKDVYIGHNVVIERNCEIGDAVAIDHNTVIKANTVVGNNSKIGSNCTIGGVGFGYERNEQSEPVLMPHIGNVRIHSHVEIGNNVCVDRAVIGSTEIGEHVKIDNLVHIAHGVSIGARSMIIANAMIAGSVIIKEDVWVSPSASIIQKKQIEKESLIGIGSVVLKDVKEGDVVAGIPAKSLKKK